MTIQKLIERDPRNRLHILRAMKLIMELQTVIVTERSQDEMGAILGHDLAQCLLTDMDVEATVPEDSMMIGSFYFIDEGLLFADNVIVVCNDCRAPVHIRPESQMASLFLCIFCAADRVLKDYWENQEE